MTHSHRPKGPGGTWKTGQRVPATGFYRDQHGTVVHFDEKSTFPPRVGWHKSSGGGAAYWTLVRAAATG